MSLLAHLVLCCTGFGIGMLLGEPWSTWRKTRRNVREEMKYAGI